MSSGESSVGCQYSLSGCDVHKATHYFAHKIKGSLADSFSFAKGLYRLVVVCMFTSSVRGTVQPSVSDMQICIYINKKIR